MLLDNFSDLFQRGLEYAWDCEHLLLKHLPKMVQAATSYEVQQALDLHLVETKGHIYRLEQIFTRLDRSPAAEKNEPIRIIVEESDKIIGHLDRSALLDAALLFFANQIEHYELGLYTSLRGFAQTLGLIEVSEFLDEILSEELKVEHHLSRLAASVNREAGNVHNTPPFALI